jgi:hypothetical protein
VVGFSLGRAMGGNEEKNTKRITVMAANRIVIRFVGCIYHFPMGHETKLVGGLAFKISYLNLTANHQRCMSHLIWVKNFVLAFSSTKTSVILKSLLTSLSPIIAFFYTVRYAAR